MTELTVCRSIVMMFGDTRSQLLLFLMSSLEGAERRGDAQGKLDALVLTAEYFPEFMPEFAEVLKNSRAAAKGRISNGTLG